jgi:hypothetical protein
MHAFASCVSYRGSRRQDIDRPDFRPPEAVANANLGKKFQGVYSLMGNLTHDLFEALLYASIDTETQPPPEQVRAERYQQLVEDFEEIWTRSYEFTKQSFLEAVHARGAGNRPVWLTHHALEHMRGRCIDVQTDDQCRGRMRQWMDSGATVVRDKLQVLIDGAPVPSWRIIEGRLLQNGEVVTPKASTQQEARTIYNQPSFWIDVDGTPLQVFCTIDFGFMRERDGRRELVVADLKTGKIQEDKHLKQLHLYGVFLVETNFGFAPEEIVLRLMYPQQEGGKCFEYPFGAEKLSEAHERLMEAARKILACYVPVDSTEASKQRLEHSFPKREAELLSGFGAIRRGESLPDGVTVQDVQRFIFRSLSPLELAEAFAHGVDDVVSPLRAAIEIVRSGCSPLTHENVNHELVLQLFGASESDHRLTDPVAFLSAMNTDRLLVPLSERFVGTASDRWMRGQKEEAVRSRPSCFTCGFSFFCHPGQAAITEFQRQSGAWR